MVSTNELYSGGYRSRMTMHPTTSMQQFVAVNTANQKIFKKNQNA